EVAQAERREGNVLRCQVDHLCAAAVVLAVDLRLIALRLRFQTPVRLGEQVPGLAVDDGLAWAHLDARRDAALCDAVRAQLALYDLRRRVVPFELGDVERARDLAVAAADALGAVPRDDAVLALLERAQHARRYTRRIDAVHALRLHE